MRPRNLFERKFSIGTLLFDIKTRATQQLTGPVDTVYVVVDDDFFERLGAQLAFHGCEFISAAAVTDAFLAQVDRVRARFIYAVECSSDGLPVIERIVAGGFKYSPAGGAPVGSYAYENSLALQTVEEEFLVQTVKGYSKFDDPGTKEDFANLCQALETTRDVEGDIVEIGCFQGSSSSLILHYAKAAGLNKRFYFFDTFDGFSYEEARKSSDTLWQGTHATDGIKAVRERLEGVGYPHFSIQRLNIITETMPAEIQRIAVANVDVDLYEAVRAGLFAVADRMAIGGIIICEDAGHTPNLIGARLALQQFLRSEAGRRFTPVFMTSGQVFLIAREASEGRR